MRDARGTMRRLGGDPQRTVRKGLCHGRFSYHADGGSALRMPNVPFYVCQMSKDVEARRAVVSLLARGVITMPEAAMLAGVSRQLLRYWVRQAGVQHERARKGVITKLWRKALRNGPKLVEMPATPPSDDVA